MKPSLPDPRNESILIHVGGQLLPRDEAKVSVFDSAVQGGDAVWEGLRIYDGKIFALDAHLDRMFDSAKAMAFDEVPTRDEIKQAIFETLEANGMRDNCHIRLTLTRGMKTSSGMSPHFNQYGPCLIVLAEWKTPVYASTGIRLITASIRRNPPQCVDSKIHHNNLINNILAKIEANVAGVDDAVMLVRQFQLAFRGHHAVAFHTADFADRKGHTDARHIVAWFTQNHGDPFTRIRRTTDDLFITFVGLNGADAQAIRIRVLFGVFHLGQRKACKALGRILDPFHFETKIGQSVANLIH